MPTKKTTKKVTKKTTKRTTRKSPKANLVESKLESAVQEKLETGERSGKSKPNKKTQFPWWGLISLLLVLIFGSVLLYQYNNDFRNNLGQMVNSTGLFKMPVTEEKVVEEPFQMNLDIVYNAADSKMKSTIDTYITNIEKNLANTKVTPVWHDKNSPEGQAMISKLEAKFLPIFTTDQNIQKHLQYSMFAAAITVKNGIYQFQAEGMEYLTLPEAGDARYIGAAPDKAKVRIIEYSSMTCEYCKMMHPILEKIAKKYSKEVSWIIKNYDRGGLDSVLEQAVECAGDENRFDQMITEMYDRQNDIFAALQATKDVEAETYNQIKISAKNVGANADKVEACVKAGTYADKVAKQTAEGLEFGVVGTPGFFINDKFIGGAMEEGAFTKLIEDELSK